MLRDNMKYQEIQNLIDNKICPFCNKSSITKVMAGSHYPAPYCSHCNGIIGYCDNLSSPTITRDFNSYGINIPDKAFDTCICCSACGEEDSVPKNGHIFYSYK